MAAWEPAWLLSFKQRGALHNHQSEKRSIDLHLNWQPKELHHLGKSLKIKHDDEFEQDGQSHAHNHPWDLAGDVEFQANLKPVGGHEIIQQEHDLQGWEEPESGRESALHQGDSISITASRYASWIVLWQIWGKVESKELRQVIDARDLRAEYQVCRCQSQIG